jgi:hypothetical protein
MERERLRRVFMQKLDSVVGYVLPLQTKEQPSSETPHPRWPARAGPPAPGSSATTACT